MIATFYSYKGGVGRTSLAVETAARLALGSGGRKPLRVALWDLDLEAPGVCHFPVVGPMSARSSAGTLDLLELLWDEPGRPSEAATAEEIDQILEQGVVTDPTVAEGRLGVLSPNAGGTIDRARLARLDLPALFRNVDDGPRLLRTVGERLKVGLGYDLILVDARTGVSDLAATATVDLPDALVFVLRMDEQDLSNVDSLVATIRRSRSHGAGESPFQILPVATFVPDPGDNIELEKRLRDRRREIVGKVISPTSSRARLSVEIPFRAASLLDECVPSLEGIAFPAATEEEYEHLANQINELVCPPILPEVPDELRRLRATRSGGIENRRKRFVSEVAELLALDGWIVAREPLTDGAPIDMRIERMGSFGRREMGLVSCEPVGGRQGVERIQDLADAVSEARRLHPLTRGLVVTGHGYTDDALARAEATDLDLLTPRDLLDSLAPLEPIRAIARREWEHTEIESRYVPLSAANIDTAVAEGDLGDEQPLEEATLEWLRAHEDGGFLAILGDFGAGKTTFVRHLAHRLATDASGTLPSPLFVDLRTAKTRALSGEGLLEHALTGASLDEPKLGAWRYRLTKDRSVVLIVDGFDEMLGYTDPPAMRDLLRELISLAKTARVILTSRTNYFISHKDAVAQLEASSASVAMPDGTELWEELTGHSTTSVLEILPFSPQQVEAYLSRVFSGRADAIAERLGRQQPLGSISRRPYLLKLVAGTVERWEQEGWPATLDLAALYDAYVAAWQSERNDHHLSLLRDGKAEHAIKIVARGAWESPGGSLTSTELAKLVAQEILPVLDLPHEAGIVERLTDELRTASFLAREDVDDRYSFVHRSFLEYFVARGIASALATSQDDFSAAIATRRLTPEVGAFLLGWADARGQLPDACATALRTTYRPQSSENALVLGIQAQRAQVRDDETSSIPEVVGYKGAQLEGAELAGSSLAAINLADANLRGANLAAARLDDSNLAGAMLDEARLDRASLERATLVEASLNGVSAIRARFTGASAPRMSARFASLDEADMRSTDLSDSDLTGSRLSAAWLDDALLEGADFSDADLRAARIRTHSRPTMSPATRLTGARIGIPDHTGVADWPAMPVPGHSGGVNALTFVRRPDLLLLASGSDDSTVRLWDAATGLSRGVLQGHTQPVQCLLAVEDQAVLISGSDDHTALVWSLTDTGPPVAELESSETVLALAYQTTPNGYDLFTGASDGSVCRWQSHADARLESVGALDSAVRALLVVPTAQGSALVAGTEAGQILRLGLNSVSSWTMVGAHDGPVQWLGMLDDQLASADRDGKVKLWDTDQWLFAGLAASFLNFDIHKVVPFAGRHGVSFAAVGTGREVAIHDGVNEVALLGHSDWVRDVVVADTSDGALLATGSDDESIRIWDPTTGQRLHTLRSHRSWVLNALGYTVRGHSMAATAGADGLLHLWDLDARRHLKGVAAHKDWIQALAIVAVNDELILVTGSEDSAIRTWSAETGEPRGALAAHTDWVQSLATLDRRGATPLLASASADGTVRVWDLGAMEEFGPPSSRRRAYHCVALIELDGEPVVIAGGTGGGIDFWHAITGFHLRTTRVTDATANSLAVTTLPSGTLVASSHGDGSLAVWDASADKLLCHIHADSPAHGTSWFDRRGLAVLASAHEDGTVRIWNAATGKLLETLRGHTDWVRSVAVSPAGTGARLITCGDDGTARVWDLDDHDGSLLLVPAAGLPEGLVMTPDVPLKRGAADRATVSGTRAAVELLAAAGPFDGVEILAAAEDLLDVLPARTSSVA